MNIIITRWISNWKNIIKDFLGAIGLFTLLFELIGIFFANFYLLMRTPKIFLMILFICIIYGLVKNYPKSKFVKKVRSKDVHIEIKIGDAFQNDGSLIIPINNEFDISLGGNVNKANSLQNKLIVDYYNSKSEHLLNDISKKIDLKKVPYPAGTTIEIKQKNKTFYLLVNSKKQANNRVSSNLDDFMLSLNGIWEHLSNNAGKDESITIPLLNTQHGRDSDLNRDIAVKQIIDTFISSTRHKIICDKLVISIYPDDLKKGQINFDNLVDYLTFQCDNYKDIKFDNKVIGKEIVISKIKSIES